MVPTSTHRCAFELRVGARCCRPGDSQDTRLWIRASPEGGEPTHERRICAPDVSRPGMAFGYDPPAPGEESFIRTRIASVILPAAALAFMHSPPVEAVVQVADHTFSLLDVQGGFDGARVSEDPSIVCGARSRAPTVPP